MKVRVVGSGNIFSEFNSASYIIDDDILIDCPNGSWKQVKNLNKNPREINHICFTHFHGDHYFDTPFYMLGKLQAEHKEINFYLDRKCSKNIKKLFLLAFPNSKEKVNTNVKINYVFDKTFKINHLNVQRVLMNHGNLKPAYGYLFDDLKIKVGFTGDTNLCANVKYLASICDYLVCDCNFLEGNNKHMGVDNILELNKEYPNTIFILSHLDMSVKEYFKDKAYKNIIIPEDGEVIIDTK